MKWAVISFFLTATIAAACGARTGLDAPPGTGRGGGGNGPVGGNGQGGTTTGGGGTGGTGGSGGTGGIPIQDDCADAGTTFIYVVTDQREIYAFDPSNEAFTFTDRGKLPCAAAGAQSMAVDRVGHAYVESNDFRIFRIGLANLASCQGTPFQNFGMNQFGMAFSSDQDGGGETLFLAGQDKMKNELVSVDVQNFHVDEIGQFSKNIGNAELTGTGDGRLFAYGIGAPDGASHLAQIDKQTADVLSDMVLPFQEQPNAWAFAWWGGDFYFFTATGGPSKVHRFQPSQGQFSVVATAPGVVVGAGVSTCAPVD
jgi:hypothetical protein